MECGALSRRRYKTLECSGVSTERRKLKSGIRGGNWREREKSCGTLTRCRYRNADLEQNINSMPTKWRP